MTCQRCVATCVRDGSGGRGWGPLISSSTSSTSTSTSTTSIIAIVEVL